MKIDHQGMEIDLSCRFATKDEAFTDPWKKLNSQLSDINRELGLPEHADLNRQQFPWSADYPTPDSIYASRLWEFPFALLSAEIESGMTCADIGCGCTPFTVALDRVGGKVTGFDPDVYAGSDTGLAFGASKEFLDRSGLDIRQGGMEAIPAEDNSFDRVFCISVIEHLDKETALMGMVEMGRILRPGGRLIMTVDVSVDHTLNEVDPLAMLWHSGLVPVGRLDLAWPKARFGYGYKENSSLDVFGLVLTKLEEPVYQQYGESEGQMIHRHRISSIRRPKSHDMQPRRRWNRVLDAALGRDVDP